MNADFPQNEREQLEAKLTALLLGELSADEAIELSKAMERDPKLVALYEQLKATIGLVRESAAHPAAESAAQAEPLKLSDERREKLLAQFKTIAPKEFEKPPRKGIRLLELAAVLVLAGFLAAMLLPSLSRSKEKALSASVRNNLRQLDGAKKQWALENNKSGDAEPTMEDLKVYLGRDSGQLPSIGGETYRPGKVSESPVAELSPNQAKRLLSKKDLATAERRDGKVEYSLNGPVVVESATSTLTLVSRAPSRNRGVSQDSFGLNTTQLPPATPPASKTEIVLPTSGQSAPIGDPKWVGVLETPTERQQAGDRSVVLGSLSSSKLSGYGDTNSDWSFGTGSPNVGSLGRLTPPDAPDNKFVGRYSYATPGQTSDIAAIHDQTRGANTDAIQLNYAAPSDISGALAKLENTNLIAGASGKFDDKAPVLGDVPVMGKLFRSESKLADSNGQFNSGLSRDDLGGLRYMVTNGVVASQPLNGDALKGESFDEAANTIMAGPVPGSTTGAGERQAEIVLPTPLGAPANHSTIVANGGSMPSSGFGGGGGGGETSTPARPLMVWGGKQVEIAAAANAEEKLKASDVKGAIDSPVRGQLPVASSFPSSSSSTNRVQGLRYVTGLDPTVEIQLAIKNYLRSNGVDMDGAGKSVFFNDRTGTLTVHGTDEDLEKVKAAIDALNVPKANGNTNSSWTIATANRVGALGPGLTIKPVIDFEPTTGAPLETDTALPKPAVPPPTPQPEILTRENGFSTFSLNVSDVSFKLAAASLEKGQMPEPASIRSEEFINAFNYRDPDAGPGVPIAFASERARYPFAHNRELLRFSLKTAAAGRQAGRPLNIVLLLDNSGSMERADRVRIIQEALRVLAGQLQPSDTFSIVTFARTATLRVDGVHGDQAAAAAAEIAKLTPEGGTNLGDALDLAYETALHHYLANGDNRVVLLTDGAANLGDVNPNALKQKVEAHRKQGVALDCFGIGWEDYNDDLLEVLTRNGDGRYGFINTPEEGTTEFVAQIAGALHVAASDVKVQVEFNPQRVTSYRQIGYAKHQLTKEQFRDNTVDAAEIAAQEAGNALYTIETNPQGEGSIATVRVRYKVPATGEYREQAWDVPYTGSAVALDQASPAMRLATTASAFSEWLATSPFAGEVTTDQLLQYLNGVPKIYGADTRPAKLEWMIRQAKSISGK